MPNIILIADTVFILIAIIFGINSLQRINSSLYSLKEDHFDIQVTFTKILDAIEANRHDIAKLKDRRDS